MLALCKLPLFKLLLFIDVTAGVMVHAAHVCLVLMTFATGVVELDTSPVCVGTLLL